MRWNEVEGGRAGVEYGPDCSVIERSPVLVALLSKQPQLFVFLCGRVCLTYFLLMGFARRRVSKGYGFLVALLS